MCPINANADSAAIRKNAVYIQPISAALRTSAMPAGRGRSLGIRIYTLTASSAAIYRMAAGHFDIDSQIFAGQRSRLAL